MIRNALFLVSIIYLAGCTGNQEASFTFIQAPDNNFSYAGRTEIFPDSSVALISPSASVSFKAMGDSIDIIVKAAGPSHNYLVVAINDLYDKRYRVKANATDTISIKLPVGKQHKIGLFKATEAANGGILFYGTVAKEIHSVEDEKKASIEFIGNSITCGMGADTTEVPCGEGEWFDQHNAYLAYGPRVARELNTAYVLSSVSGIGIYRNWNDENVEEPIMPQVYENLYLNADSSKRYPFGNKPDIVSICLGTNDLSDGDGIKERLAFNKQKFVNNYTQFIKTIYRHYPDTRLALLTSPMISGEKGEILLDCLKQVKDNFEGRHSISVFEFAVMVPGGCTYHPTVSDHEEMANQLVPFYDSLLTL